MEANDALLYPCEMCGAQSASRTASMLHYIRNHRYDQGFVATCRYQGCQASYRNWLSFKSHLRRKHRNEVIPEEPPILPDVERAEDFPEHQEMELDPPQPPAEHDMRSVLRGHYIKYIQHVREGCNISQKATDLITAGIFQFSEDTLSAFKECLLQSADEDGKVSVANVQEIFTNFQLSKAAEDVKTKFLLDKFLVQSGFLIMPEVTTLGIKWVWARKPRVRLVRKAIKFYEIPFFDLLQQLLNQEDVLYCVDNPRPPQIDGALNDYQDGEYVRSHPLFGNDPRALKIILYYDDVEIANPLGSKVKTHKLAMFYWTLANIFPEYRSTLKIINLLCIVNSIHLRQFGMNKILEHFVRDMKQLESPEGKVFLINGVQRTFRGSLLLFAGDTLAANYVGGFKEGVALAKKPCRVCLGTDETTRMHFTESQFTLRDKATHLEQCAVLEDAGLSKEAKQFWSREYGITGKSSLCKIETFDISKCLPQDLMHVAIEGVLELELRLFVKYCVESKLFKLKMLNSCINAFDYGHLIKDKPTLIEPQHLENKLRQNCAQLITLGNTLPFMIGNYIDDDDERLVNLVLFLQILNGLLSFKTTKDEVLLMKNMIQVHHTKFVSLYRRPTPKFHYMVHLPNQILNFGPCRQHWCMRFEGAHCRFKHMATVVKNFKNIALTLAYRHQSLRCAELFTVPNEPSNKVLYRGDIVAPGISTQLAHHEHSECVAECLNVHDFDQMVLVTKSINVKGTTYNTNSIILLCDDENDLPHFGKVTDIVVLDANKILLFEKLETMTFVPSNNSYEVSKMYPKVIFAIRVDRLIHPHPLSLFRVQNQLFVLLLNHRRNEYY